MANFNLVVDSRFNPFTYQELLSPVLMATQAHQQLEDAYSELSTKANVWAGLANEQTDKKTYTQYKNYANDLKAQADALASQGLNTTSRQAMMNLKSRYASEITPIEQAYTARAKEAEQQQAGKAAGMVYEGDAATSSLDRYLGNAQIRYEAASSQEGFKRLGTEAAAIANKLREYKKSGRMDAYNDKWLKTYGIDIADIDSAIADMQEVISGNITNPRSANILTRMLSNEMTAAGINNWNNSAKAEYMNKVMPALYAAQGKEDASMYQNIGAVKALELANQKELIDYQNEQEAKKGLIAWDPNTTNLYQEGNAKYAPTQLGGLNLNDPQSKIAAVKAAQDMHLVDGKMNLTKAGKEVISRVEKFYNTPASKRGKFDLPGSDREFYALMNPLKAKEYGIIKTDANGNMTTGSSFVNQYTQVSRARLSDSQSSTLAGTILANMSRDRITPIGSLDSKNKKIGEGRETMSRADFEEYLKDHKIIYIGNNAATDQQFFQLDNGIWYHMPSAAYGQYAKDVMTQSNQAMQNSGGNSYIDAIMGSNVMSQLSQPAESWASNSEQKPYKPKVTIPFAQ